MAFDHLTSSNGNGDSALGYGHVRSQSSENISLPSYERVRERSLSFEREVDAVEVADRSPMLREPLENVMNRVSHRSPTTSNTASEIVYDQPTKWSIPRKPIPKASVYQLAEQEVVESNQGVTISQHESENSIFRIWWFELVSCLLCLSALLAIIVTVYFYDGQPLPNWPYGLGISSLIAIYSIVFRAAGGLVLSEGLGQLKWALFETPQPLHDMGVYDDSTRGPLGCIYLLTNLQRRQFVARAGALATLALLVIDPFNQQILFFKGCSWPDPSNQAFAPRTQAQYGHGIRHWTGTQLIETDMENALQAAIFAPRAVQIAPVCATGNCTWEPYHTIGYCHQCIDVTHYVVITRDENTTVVELPSDQGLIVVNSTTPYVMVAEETHDALYALADGVNLTKPYSRAARQSWPSFLIPGSDVDASFDNSTQTRAYKCKIETCVRKLNTTIRLGKLEEQTLATYTDWSDNDSPVNNTRSMVHLDCLSAEQRQTLVNLGYRFTSNDKFIAYDGALMSNGTIFTTSELVADELLRKKLSTIPAHCIYTMADAYEQGLYNFIRETFRGKVVGIQYPKFNQDPGSKVLRNLYMRGPTLNSFNEAMSEVAISMTNYLREASIPSLSTPAEGKAEMYTTCVYVRWWWMAYVVVIAILIIIFFAITVADTTFSQTKWRHNFKNSALALMCAGLDEETSRQLRATLLSGNLNDLQAASKKVPVRFVHHEGKFIQDHT